MTPEKGEKMSVAICIIDNHIKGKIQVKWTRYVLIIRDEDLDVPGFVTHFSVFMLSYANSVSWLLLHDRKQTLLFHGRQACHQCSHTHITSLLLEVSDIMFLGLVATSYLFYL